MSEDKENPNLDEAIDPPDHQGGGGEGISMDAPEGEASAIDPPDNQGGGGQ